MAKRTAVVKRRNGPRATAPARLDAAAYAETGSPAIPPSGFVPVARGSAENAAGTLWPTRNSDGSIHLLPADGTNILRTPVTLAGHVYSLSDGRAAGNRSTDNGSTGSNGRTTLTGRRTGMQLIVSDARVIVCDDIPATDNDPDTRAPGTHTETDTAAVPENTRSAQRAHGDGDGQVAGHFWHSWISTVSYSRRHSSEEASAPAPVLLLTFIETSPHRRGEQWTHSVQLEFDKGVHPGRLAMDIVARIAAYDLRIGAPKKARDALTTLTNPPMLPNPPRGETADYDMPTYVSRPDGVPDIDGSARAAWITRDIAPPAARAEATERRGRAGGERTGGNREGKTTAKSGGTIAETAADSSGGAKPAARRERTEAALAAATPSPQIPPDMFAAVPPGSCDDAPSSLHPTRNADGTVHLLPIDGDDILTVKARSLRHDLGHVIVGDLGDGLVVKRTGEAGAIARYRDVTITITGARLIVRCTGPRPRRGGAGGGGTGGGDGRGGGSRDGGGKRTELLAHLWYPWIRTVSFQPKQTMLGHSAIILYYSEDFPAPEHGHWRHRLELGLPGKTHPGDTARELTRRIAAHDLLAEPPESVWQRLLALTDSPLLPDPPRGEYATYALPAHVNKPGGILYTVSDSRDWHWTEGQ